MVPAWCSCLPHNPRGVAVRASTLPEMSALLSYLKIVDTKTYRAWCLANHPDKCPASERAEATRKFQEVGAEFDRVYKKDSKRSASSAVPQPRSSAAKASQSVFTLKDIINAPPIIRRPPLNKAPPLRILHDRISSSRSPFDTPTSALDKIFQN